MRSPGQLADLLAWSSVELVIFYQYFFEGRGIQFTRIGRRRLED